MSKAEGEGSFLVLPLNLFSQEESAIDLNAVKKLKLKVTVKRK